jgi:hypothetical protein
MFVTDTTDAAYPPEDFLPESIMDRLSEILSEHNHTRVRPLTVSLSEHGLMEIRRTTKHSLSTSMRTTQEPSDGLA